MAKTNSTGVQLQKDLGKITYDLIRNGLYWMVSRNKLRRIRFAPAPNLQYDGSVNQLIEDLRDFNDLDEVEDHILEHAITKLVKCLELRGKPVPVAAKKANPPKTVSVILLDDYSDIRNMIEANHDEDEKIDYDEVVIGGRDDDEYPWFKHKDAKIDDGAEIGSGSYIGRGARILPGVKIEDRVFIGDDAVVSKSTIGANCVLGVSSTVQDSTLKQEVTLGDRAEVKFSSVGDYSSIASEACVSNSQLSHQVKVGHVARVAFSRIAYNVDIMPGIAVTKSFLEDRVTISKSVDQTQLHAGTVLKAGNWHMSVGPLGSRTDFFTVVEDADRKLWIYIGCSETGRTLEDIVEQVKVTHTEGSEYYCEYMTMLGAIQKMRRDYWKIANVKLPKIKVPKAKPVSI